MIAYRIAHTRPRSLSLFAVHLVGRARTAHRAQAVIRIALSLAAMVAYFLPWHAVHMVGTELDGLKKRPTFTCSGWSHVATELPVAALLGTIPAWLAFRWPKLSAALFLPSMTLGALLAIRYAIDSELHRFDSGVVVLDPQRVFDGLWLALVVASLVDLALVPLLFAFTRGRLAQLLESASTLGSIAGGSGGGSGV